MFSQHRFKFKPLTAAVIAALAAPTAALAQTATAQAVSTDAPAAQATPAIMLAQTTTASEQALPEVKVTAPADNSFKSDSATLRGSPTVLRDVPQSVTIINQAVMQSQGATSLADALRNVPGLTIGGAEGGSIGNSFNLRGFSARTDMYLDGSKDRGQYYRDLFSLDSVEVLKGPSSMLFGRGSTGGVINQISKAPSLTPHNEISVTAGTQPSGRVVADFNQPLSDTAAARVSIMAQDVNSTRNVMENKDYGIAPSLRFGIGTPTEVTLTSLIQHNTDMPDYGLPPLNGGPAPVSKNNFYGVTDDRLQQDIHYFNARLDHRFSQTTSLRNQFSYNNVNIDAKLSGPNNVGTVNGVGVYTPLLNGNATGNYTNVPLGNLFVQLGAHDRKINDNTMYNQTDLTTEFSTGFIKHTVISGIELGRETYDNQAYGRTNMPVLSLLSPAEVTTPANSVQTIGNHAQSSAYTYAPYVNDTMELSKEWKLVAGLRWDHYSASVNNSITSATAAGNSNQTNTFTSVRSGVIYQPNSVQSYYAAYGTSFNPSLDQLTSTTGTQSLDPATSRSMEVGTKWDLFSNTLSLTGAVFSIDQNNIRTQVSPGVFQTVGKVQVNGAELGVTGRITPKWQIMAGYAYLDSEIKQGLPTEQGRVFANTPRNSVSAWSTYNLTKEYELGGGATYMSDRFVANNNLVRVGDYVRWDTTAAYHQPGYDVRLNVLNVFNKYNFDALIPSDGGRSVPGLSRTALVTYTYKF